jgi:mitogen-activated protein kinase 15
MWALGCILGEMLSGRPMFPGTSTMNQLEKIIEVTGMPSAEDLEAIKSAYAATMLESMPPTRQTTLASLFPNANPQALDLMNQCLQFNPTKRISSANALAHPFVAEFHNSAEEPDYPHGPIHITVESSRVNDNTKLTAAFYRDMLYRDINSRRKEARKKEQVLQGSRRLTDQPDIEVAGG